jgi:poly(beta-D-mannuronate) lyase
VKQILGLTAFSSLLILAATAGAATKRVDSYPAIRAAVESAVPGDRIVVAAGSYAFDAPIVITGHASAESPIIVESESVGGATITGNGGFAMGGEAAHAVVRGFVFKHLASTSTIGEKASHCRFTRNVFELRGSGGQQFYLAVYGDSNEIDFNSFQNKKYQGRMLTIEGAGPSEVGNPAAAQGNWVHHNRFRDFPNCGANNCSAIQLGSDNRSLTPAHTLIERNLFTNTQGENENIANKSSDNVYRYNTFAENSTELSLRHGNRNRVYGNYFFNTAGIRIFGDGHRIHSNYFQGCSPAINVGNGAANIPPADVKEHDRPDNVTVAFNTLVDNRSNVVMDSRGGGLGATGLRFFNNIIAGGGTAVAWNGPTPGATYGGNILHGSSPGNLPTGGYTSLDPLLAVRPDGTRGLGQGSPAIGRGSGDFIWVDVDMDGQDRFAPLDAGADQFSPNPVSKVLTPADVGPDANDETVRVQTVISMPPPSWREGMSFTSHGIVFQVMRLGVPGGRLSNFNLRGRWIKP